MLDVPRKDLHELRIDAHPTASEWPTIQSTTPRVCSCRPGAPSVPLAIATVRGAPPSRIGSVSERCSEAFREGVRGAHTTAPPEKLKNDRKKLEAAKAMDRPKTIWISLRNPPDVSPNASEARGDDDDDGDDASYRPLDGFEDGLQRAFPASSRRPVLFQPGTAAARPAAVLAPQGGEQRSRAELDK